MNAGEDLLGIPHSLDTPTPEGAPFEAELQLAEGHREAARS